MHTNISLHKKTKLCFLTNGLRLGGTERVLIDSVSLISPFYDVTIIPLFQEPLPLIREALEKAGATIIAPKIKERPIFLSVPFLSKFDYEKVLRDIEYDYLFCINNVTLNAGFNKKAKKTILWNHMDNIQKHVHPKSFLQKIKSAYLGFMHRKYDAVWSVCDKVKDDYIEAFSIKHAYTLTNPLDYDAIISKSSLSCSLQFDSTKKNVVTVARLHPEKGVDRLLHSWINTIAHECPDAHLYIIGWGNEHQQYEDLIKESNFSDRITLLGPQSNPFPYLKQADLFVCPSRKESFGLVILEAMALSIPVITTATTGGKYTTKDSTLAMCVENTDKALTKAILDFLKSPENYPYSLENARKSAQSYDLSQYKENILSLLNQLER